MKLYLYKCEGCNVPKLLVADKGNVYCVFCKVCNGCEFHCKVVVRENPFLLPYIDDEYEFYELVKGEKNDSDGNRKEEDKTNEY